MPKLTIPSDFRARQLRMKQLLAEVSEYQDTIAAIRYSIRGSFEVLKFSLSKPGASLETELQICEGAMAASWAKLPSHLPCWEIEARHLQQFERRNDRERQRQRAKRLAKVGGAEAREAMPRASTSPLASSTTSSYSLDAIEAALRKDALAIARQAVPTDEEKMRALMDGGQEAPAAPIIPEF